jgi:hypothetical protein
MASDGALGLARIAMFQCSKYSPVVSAGKFSSPGNFLAFPDYFAKKLTDCSQQVRQDSTFGASRNGEMKL